MQATTTTQRPSGAWQLYLRALGLLGSEKVLAATLIVAGMIIAVIQVVEQQLFGRVVDALAKGQSAFAIIGLWAGLGLWAPSRPASSSPSRPTGCRTASGLLPWAPPSSRPSRCPSAITREPGSGAVVRSILAGTDALFWHVVVVPARAAHRPHRHHVPDPVAIAMDWRMASILGVLAVFYVSPTSWSCNAPAKDRPPSSSYHPNVYGQVGDVLGNVTVVQSYPAPRGRDAGHARYHEPVAGGPVSGAHMVGPAHGDDASLPQPLPCCWCSPSAPFSRRGARSSVGVDRGLRRLLAPADRQARSDFRLRRRAINQQAPTLRTYFNLLDAQADVIEQPDAIAARERQG